MRSRRRHSFAKKELHQVHGSGFDREEEKMRDLLAELWIRIEVKCTQNNILESMGRNLCISRIIGGQGEFQSVIVEIFNGSQAAGTHRNLDGVVDVSSAFGLLTKETESTERHHSRIANG